VRDTLARLAIVVALVVVPGCSGDDDVMPDDDMTGLWTFTADGASPPETLVCSGGHVGLENLPLCNPFDLDLAQVGASFSGTSSQMYCSADIMATGTVNGDSLAGEVVIDGGASTQRFTFTGTVTGDSAVIDPGSFSVDGLTGSCTTSGFYNAVR